MQFNNAYYYFKNSIEKGLARSMKRKENIFYFSLYMSKCGDSYLRFHEI